MKKNLLLLTAVTMSLVMTSCGSKKEGEETTKGDAAKEESAVTEETEAPKSEPFTSEAGKFTIDFKSKPTEQPQNVPTDAGDITMYTFIYEESRTKAYMVAYCDYPAEAVAKQKPTDLLQNSKMGVISKFSATVNDEKMSKFQGHDAIDFTATGPQYSTAYKIILAGNRLYQVAILQSSGPVPQDDVDSFIGTFKINE